MMSAPAKTTSLSRTIFTTLLAFSLVVMMLFVVLASLVLYNTYELKPSVRLLRRRKRLPPCFPPLPKTISCR